MLKHERLFKILSIINEQGFVNNKTLMESLNVSDMTIRRDLDELANEGKIIRIHGGAQSMQKSELSHLEKKEINIEEKKEAAILANSLIDEYDSIFLGPGTTLEFLAEEIKTKNIRILTNSLPIFESLQKLETDYEIYLIGGMYRKRTGAFIGALAEEALSNLKIDKAFIGVNGINNATLYNANIEEGRAHQIILNNASQKIIVADYNKINKDDFYGFYSLNDIDLLVTNPSDAATKLQQENPDIHIITK